MEFASPPSTLPSSAQRNSHVGHRRVGCLQISSHTPSRESRPSAPTLSAASLGEAASTDVRRPTPLGMAVRGLDRLAIFLGHRQTGNRHWLAPQGLPAVLDVESPSWPSRAPPGAETDWPTASEDKPRESA